MLVKLGEIGAELRQFGGICLIGAVLETTKGRWIGGPKGHEEGF